MPSLVQVQGGVGKILQPAVFALPDLFYCFCSGKSKAASASAPKNKPAKQLEELDTAEKMVDDLLSSDLGTLVGSSAQTFDKLAKDLGSCYLTGLQTSFTRIALAVCTVQKDPQAHRALRKNFVSAEPFGCSAGYYRQKRASRPAQERRFILISD